MTNKHPDSPDPPDDTQPLPGDGQHSSQHANPDAGRDTSQHANPDASPDASPDTNPDQQPDASAAPRHSLRYTARTDRGLLRATNQDSVFAGDRLLVVADGMGGHAAGDKASRLVVDRFSPLNGRAPDADLLSGLMDATRQGNRAIADTVTQHPEFDGMGTTVTAMLFDGHRAGIAHVGDSRAYLYRSGVLQQLTRDDTFVQSLVDEGRITEGQAHEHPQRNLLLRALTGTDLDPSLTVREVRRGDRYLLCSDGLSGVVPAEPIADALAHPDPETAADTLVQLALVHGGPDNVTVIVADVIHTGDEAHDAGMTGSSDEPRDPDATRPIDPLTREMPRVPLPPIPEEPAAPATRLAGDDDVDTADDDLDDDLDDVEDDLADDLADNDEDGESSPAARPTNEASDETSGAGGGSGPSGAEGRAGNDAARRGRAGTRKAGDGRGNGRGGGPAAGPRGTEQRSGSGAAAARGDQDGPGARRRWQRRTALAVAIVVVVGAIATGATLWVRNQFYVSTAGGVVSIFRGVDGSLLGWHFSTAEEDSCRGDDDCHPILVKDLQPAAQYQVRSGIRATSLADARDVIRRLSDEMLPPCPPHTDTGQAPDTSSYPVESPHRTPSAHGIGGSDEHPAETPSAPPAPTAGNDAAPEPPPPDATGPGRTAQGLTTQGLAAPGGTPAPVTVTQTVTSIPLAPAAVPGVTCREVP